MRINKHYLPITISICTSQTALVFFSSIQGGVNFTSGINQNRLLWISAASKSVAECAGKIVPETRGRASEGWLSLEIYGNRCNLEESMDHLKCFPFSYRYFVNVSH